jgi:threonine dehydrogenase-like Zn-dependent dehydrogenase
MVTPASTLVPLPDQLSFEEGAAISCGTGTAYFALERLAVSGRDTVAIFGQGPVGLSATLLASAMGAQTIALDVIRERRQFAQAFGADAVLDPASVDPVAALRELTKGEGVDVALDCTGLPDARIAAVRSAATWGRVGFVGEGGATTFDISKELIRKQLTIVASWTFSRCGQEACARFIVKRHLPLKQLITHRFPLECAGDAYELFDQQTIGKPIIVPSR